MRIMKLPSKTLRLFLWEIRPCRYIHYYPVLVSLCSIISLELYLPSFQLAMTASLGPPLALGINLPMVAFAPFNSMYQDEGVNCL